MLVLSRRLNEKIVLPNIQTTFEILGIRGGAVRLGVQAPDVVAVYREEVWARDKHRTPVRDLLRDGPARAGLQEVNHLLRNRLNASAVGLANATTQVLDFAGRPPKGEGVKVTDEGEGGTRIAEYLVAQKLI